MPTTVPPIEAPEHRLPGPLPGSRCASDRRPSQRRITDARHLRIRAIADRLPQPWRPAHPELALSSPGHGGIAALGGLTAVLCADHPGRCFAARAAGDGATGLTVAGAATGGGTVGMGRVATSDKGGGTTGGAAAGVRGGGAGAAGAAGVWSAAAAGAGGTTAGSGRDRVRGLRQQGRASRVTAAACMAAAGAGEQRNRRVLRARAAGWQEPPSLLSAGRAAGASLAGASPALFAGRAEIGRSVRPDAGMLCRFTGASSCARVGAAFARRATASGPHRLQVAWGIAHRGTSATGAGAARRDVDPRSTRRSGCRWPALEREYREWRAGLQSPSQRAGWGWLGGPGLSLGP